MPFRALLGGSGGGESPNTGVTPATFAAMLELFYFLATIYAAGQFTAAIQMPSLVWQHRMHVLSIGFACSLLVAGCEYFDAAALSPCFTAFTDCSELVSVQLSMLYV